MSPWPHGLQQNGTGMCSRRELFTLWFTRKQRERRKWSHSQALAPSNFLPSSKFCLLKFPHSLQMVPPSRDQGENKYLDLTWGAVFIFIYFFIAVKIPQLGQLIEEFIRGLQFQKVRHHDHHGRKHDSRYVTGAVAKSSHLHHRQIGGRELTGNGAFI